MGLRSIIILALAIASVLAPTATACNKAVPPAFTSLGEWEPQVRYHLKADGTKTYLSEASTGGSNSYTPSTMGMPSGATTWPNAMQGRATDTIEFALEKPMDRTRYLNLSKPIVGTLFLTSTIQSTAGRADPWAIRLEILQGDVLVGGFDRRFDADEVRSGFFAHNFCFRPEVRSLDAGQTLKVRITRIATAGDLSIGTGGSTGSFIEVHYFDSDPLVGALYIEKGKIVKVPSQEPPSGGEDAGAGLFAAPLLLALALPRRARPAVLAAFLLLMAGLAGCLGGGAKEGPGATESGKPSASVKYEDLPPGPTGGTEGPGETGSLVGRIVDPMGLPVKGANVLIPGTSHFANAASGTFRFDGLPPRTYTVRVDKTGFVSYEGPVEILANKVANLTITLTYPETKQANDKRHFHDDWNGETEKTLMNGPVTPLWSYKDAVADGASAGVTKLPVSVVVPAGASRGEACPGYGGCSTSLRLPPNAYILPGAREAEITLTWSGTNVVRELALTIQTSVNLTFAPFVARESGKPFRVAFFPNEADFGHQRYSDWAFILSTLPASPGQPFSPPVHLMSQLGVKVRIFKGTVPYEDPHTDLWGNQTTFPVVNAVARRATCLNCDYPLYHSDSMWSVSAFSSRIPADAREVQGVLTWSGGAAGPGATPWSLVYRPANHPLIPDSVSKYPKPDEAKASAGKYEFTIKLEEGEADQFYQKFSKWYLFIDDGDQPAKGVTVSPTTEWRLTVTAHK